MKPKAINTRAIRTENRRRILQLLIKERELTILEVSRALGISIPTVTRNVEQFIAEGLAEKAGVSASVVGRKPMLLRFLPDAYYAVGVEFSMEYARLVLTNLDIAIKTERTLTRIDYHDIDRLMRSLQQEIKDMLAEHGVAARKLLGIGIALPGIVNEETRVLKMAPNLGLIDLDFAQYEPGFGVPVFIENEANAAAMAELALGIAKEMRNLVYISVLLKGIGTGIVVDGQLYKGKNKRAGEYGHITISSLGKRCACGRKDCWELYASGHVLLTEYARKTGEDAVQFAQFFAALQSGEPAAAQVLDAYLEYLALGMEDIILAQDPHYVIIGGILTPFKEHFLGPLREKIFRKNNFYNQNDVNVICSTLQGNASILGAALLPCQKKLFEAA